MPDTPASLDHIAYGVADPDRATAWYRTAGFDVASVGRLIPVAAAARQRRIDEPGTCHICLRTADIAGAYSRLVSCGARFLAPPARSPVGPALAYFHDPEGTLFQLLEIEEGPLAVGRPPALPEAVGVLHHIGLTVSDLPAAVTWFERRLGLPIVVRAHASGAPAGAALGLSEVEYDAVALMLGDHSIELLGFRGAASGAGGAAETDGAAESDGAAGACLSVSAPDGPTGSLTGPEGLRVDVVAPLPVHGD